MPARLAANDAGEIVSAASGPLLLDDLVGYRLRQLHGLFQDSWREYFGRLGLAVTPVQGGVLMLIERHPGVTQSELARLLRIETPTLHELVKRLIEAGLVQRTSRPTDRRTHALDLTDSGRDAVAVIRARVAEQEATALAPLSDTERRQLAELIGRVLARRAD